MVMSKSSTPTTVRVARWAAIAALITAAGSMFNTVWTEKPWWKEEAPTPIAAEAFTSPNGTHRVRPAPSRATAAETMSVEASEGAPMMTMSPSPEPTLWQKTQWYFENHTTATWLVAGSFLIGLGWLVSELFFHRKKKIEAKLKQLSTLGND